MIQVVTKVPGKLMLAGEYAVLEGHPCIAATVESAMTIRVQERRVGITLSSDLWDDQVSFESGHDDEPNQPFSQAASFGARLFELPGFAAHVDTGLCTTTGFGSSSAIRLGLLIALHSLKHRTPSSQEACWAMGKHAFQLQKSQQKIASGYDLATQLSGGLVHIQPTAEWPGKVTRLCPPEIADSWLHFWRGGRGNPTGATIHSTTEFLKRTDGYEAFIQQMNRLVETLKNRLLGAMDLSYVIREAATCRMMMEPCPDFPTGLATGLKSLPGVDQTWTFKTTGAGGEDALLLIGEEHHLAPAFQYLRDHHWEPLGSCLKDQTCHVEVSNLS